MCLIHLYKTQLIVDSNIMTIKLLKFLTINPVETQLVFMFHSNFIVIELIKILIITRFNINSDRLACQGVPALVFGRQRLRGLCWLLQSCQLSTGAAAGTQGRIPACSRAPASPGTHQVMDRKSLPGVGHGHCQGL